MSLKGSIAASRPLGQQASLALAFISLDKLKLTAPATGQRYVVSLSLLLARNEPDGRHRL